MRVRTYGELVRLATFEERFRYLSLDGVVGGITFGSDRWINQAFYRSNQWRRLRNEIIVRDNGCDLAVEGFEIHESVYIHHMNPMSVDDIKHGDSDILNPEFLISTTHRTHNAIHYGDENLLPQVYVPRSPGDTKLW
jgi:hypothetical protein